MHGMQAATPKRHAGIWRDRNVVNGAEMDAAVALLIDRADGLGVAERDAMRRIVWREIRRSPMSFEPVRRSAKGDPSWVKQRLKEGVSLWRFTELDGFVQARAICACLELASLCEWFSSGGQSASDFPLSWRNGKHPPSRRAAEAILCKLPRLELDGLGERLQSVRAMIARETLRLRWDELLVPPRSVAGSAGREWRAVRSIGEARTIGARFGNCLARPESMEHYALAMPSDRCRMEVLRDVHGDRAEHLLVAWIPAIGRITDMGGPCGRYVPTRYREDVRQLMIAEGLCQLPSDRGADLGILPETFPVDPAPWAEGFAAEASYRVWAWRSAVLVEHGEHDPLLATFRLPVGEPVGRMADLGLDGPSTRLLERAEKRRVAEVLIDAASRARRIPAAVARLLAIIAHSWM